MFHFGVARLSLCSLLPINRLHYTSITLQGSGTNKKKVTPANSHTVVVLPTSTVIPIKLETGLRLNSAGIPYILLLRIEAIGFPTFWLLLYTVVVLPTSILLLMDKILHDPKDPKLWELWYIPYSG